MAHDREEPATPDAAAPSAGESEPEATPLDESRLIKLLARLGSSHDGEVLNAARLADRLVRQAGLTWDDVLAGPRRRLWKQLRRERHKRRAPEPAPDEAGERVGLPRVETLTDRQILDVLIASPLIPARMRHELRPLIDRLTGNTLPVDDRAYVRTLYTHVIFYGRAI